uniref:Methenyltetrahydrofolate synthetase domain containing n=1 Tax=Canis lupus familiaris TaxID=9615 RepID=A0A8C0SIE8_CANLF
MRAHQASAATSPPPSRSARRREGSTRAGDVTPRRIWLPEASLADCVVMELPTGVSKQDIRQQIWDYMESQNLADFPRPVHHRIPNFKGSYLACQNIRDLEVFTRTQEVKVDPDKPLEGVRLLMLQKQSRNLSFVCQKT